MNTPKKRPAAVIKQECKCGGEEELYIHHERTYINICTIFCFIIAAVTMTYQNLSNIQNTLKQSPSLPYKKKHRLGILTNTTNRTINTTIDKVENDTLTDALPSNLTSINKDEKTETKKKQKSRKKASKKDSITNSYDKKILRYISEGELYFKHHQYPECISFFEKLYKKYNLSPRSVYGQAICLDKLSEQMRSNELLKKAITAYGEVAKQPDVPHKLLKLALITQAKKYIFLGDNRRAVVVLNDLSRQIPNDLEILNELGIAYLMMGANNQAKKVFEQALKVDSTNGVALVHYGFVLKMHNMNEECIPYLLDGIRSEAPGTSDSRFYFHLGDAYTRTGKTAEAWKVYNEAAEKGIFLSAEQRSIYNAESQLRAQPWWDIEETGYKKQIRLLEYHWKTIRDEAQAILKSNDNMFPREAESLLDTGDWRQFELYTRGKKHVKNCERVPKTCALLEKMTDATENKRGQIKYSLMKPGTHVWPHTGPTNCRLRTHLGLIIPKDVFIRVGSETRTWENGKALIIDDSFDHEVWHKGTKPRLILIVDFWHPDIPQWERNTLTPI